MRRDLSISGLLYRHSIFALANAGLITHGCNYTCLELYSSATPNIYSLCVGVMPVIRWLIIQEVCLGLNLPAILNLIWPGHPLLNAHAHMKPRRLPMNIPLLLCYTVHVIYSQPIRLTAGYVLPYSLYPAARA